VSRRLQERTATASLINVKGDAQEDIEAAEEALNEAWLGYAAAFERSAGHYPEIGWVVEDEVDAEDGTEVAMSRGPIAEDVTTHYELVLVGSPVPGLCDDESEAVECIANKVGDELARIAPTYGFVPTSMFVERFDDD
jgi:hypothetical protein